MGIDPPEVRFAEVRLCLRAHGQMQALLRCLQQDVWTFRGPRWWWLGVAEIFHGRMWKRKKDVYYDWVWQLSVFHPFFWGK